MILVAEGSGILVGVGFFPDEGGVRVEATLGEGVLVAESICILLEAVGWNNLLDEELADLDASLDWSIDAVG